MLAVGEYIYVHSSLFCEMFTNQEVHAKHHALEPQTSLCYGYLEQQQQNHANGI